MSSDQVRTVILEAVDCLRQRKCRPDRESIAVFVMRKLGSSMNEIYSEIENSVDHGNLLKVEYKGSTSYRSPKNFDLKNSPLLTKHSKILNSSKTTRYVISGMNELLSTFPNYTQEGIPLEELKKKLSGFDEERFTETSFKVIFEREEAAGAIQIAESTDDTLPYPTRVFPKDLQVPESMKLISFLEDPNPPPESKSRKRVKKPSEEGEGQGTPKAKTTTPHKNNVKAKKKPEVVYAVKSDPNKAPKIKQEPADVDDVQAKANQISSIGLKVLAGKTPKTPKQPKGKGNSKGGAGGTDSITDKTQIDELYNRTPSLGLVKHEAGSANSSEEVPTHVPDVANGVADGGSKSKVVPSKAVKRKSEATNSPKGSRPSKPKKSKLTPTPVTRSENDTDFKLSVSKEPPRYTYSAKRRARYNSFEDEDNRLERSRSPPDEDNGGSPNGHAEICAACRKQENSAGQAEDFLSCGTCNAKIHPTCIDYSEDHAKRLRMNSKSNEPHLQWQCFSCKRCGVCQKALMSSKNNKIDSEKRLTKKEQRYVLCDRCDRGYHASCVNRTLPAPINESSWFCSECEEASSKTENGSTTAKGSVSPKKSNTGKQPVRKTAVKTKGRQQSRQSDGSETTTNKNGIHSANSSSIPESSSSNPEGDNEIPDISSWTPTQVQNYFTEKGLREEASSLREQEIDGMSLMLLRRADVIFGLNLRLGPALKIYRLVCQLQQHSSALKKKGNSSSSGVKATETHRPND